MNDMLLAGLHAIFKKEIRHTTVKASYQLFYLSKITRHLVFIKRIGTVLKQVFCLIPYIYRLTELFFIMFCNYTSYDTNLWHLLILYKIHLKVSQSWAQLSKLYHKATTDWWICQILIYDNHNTMYMYCFMKRYVICSKGPWFGINKYRFIMDLPSIFILQDRYDKITQSLITTAKVFSVSTNWFPIYINYSMFTVFKKYDSER